MDANSAEYLINALLEAGVWNIAQAEHGRSAVAGHAGVWTTLSDKLKSAGPLTGYQYRKIRHGRIMDLTVGSFVILEKIGEGGMGKVYKAISQKFGKPVALKVVRSHLMSNKTVLRRYKREASAAAAMDHPNIVTLIDADEVGGKCYLAMEYVEGSDLSRLVKENGPLPYQEAAEYIRQAALGLQHAHERGLIHRDIKPSNLLVSGERALPGTDGLAHVKILDMGLVRSIMDDEDVSRTELTRDGTVVGTPDYMAPEQAKNSSKVDGKADLYSLGATLFYLIRGQSPFPEGSPIDKLLRHQLDPPPDLKKLRPDLPPGLVAVVNRLLKKKPEERYSNAAELAVAIQPYTPSADVGLVFSAGGVADGDTDVSLDLPAGQIGAANNGFILDAEIVTDDVVKAPAAAAVPVPIPTPKPPAETRTAKRTAPRRIAKPNPGPSTDPNSGSLPGPDPTTRQGTTQTRTASSRSTSERTPPRGGYKRPTENKNRKMLGIVLAAAFVIVLFSGIILILVNGGSKPTHKSTTQSSTTTPPTTNNAGVEATPPVHHPAVLARSELIIADQAVAVVVISPQQFWKRPVYEQTPRPNQMNWLKWLVNRYAFDSQLLDRVTVSLLPREESIAVGEGGGITASWIEKLKKTHEIKDMVSGWRNVSTVLSKTAKSTEYPHVLLLGTEALALGTQTAEINAFGRKYAQNKSAENVDKSIIAELPKSEDENPPFVTFIAGKQWRFPDADRKPLSDYGVSLLVAKMRINGDDYDLELTLTGENEKQLKNEFLSLGVATHLTDKFPAFKPFQLQITNATPETIRESGHVKIKISSKCPIASVHDWLEPLIGLPPVN